jgi:hypothetical protein
MNCQEQWRRRPLPRRQQGHTAVASLLRHWSLTIPRRLATYAFILHAIDLEEGRATQNEPVTKLLQRLARTPDDIVRVIVLFVGDGGVQRRVEAGEAGKRKRS